MQRRFLHLFAGLMICLCSGALIEQAEARFKKVGRAAESAGSAGAKAAGAAGVLAATSAHALVARAAIFVEAVDSVVVFRSVSSGTVKVVSMSDDIADVARGMLAGARSDTPFVMSHETAVALGRKIDDLPKLDRDIFIVDSSIGPLPLRIVRTADGTVSRFREIRPGLLVGLEQELSEDVVALLSTAARKERIRVVSLFDASDVDTIKRLSDVAGDRFFSVDKLIDAKGKLRFRETEGTIVIAVGHVEDGAFVSRNAAGTVTRRVPIADFERAARDADVTLLSAGCGCYGAGAGAGFAGPVTDVGVVESLKGVFSSNTYADMLAAFGRAEAPFVITNNAMAALAKEHALRLEVLAMHEGKVTAGMTSLRMTSVRSASTWLGAAAVWLGVGAVAFGLMFRTNRDAFLRVLPVLPPEELRPVQQVVMRGLRESLFFLVGPLLSIIVVISFFIGGWRFRDVLHLLLWLLVVRPAGLLRMWRSA